MPKASCSVRWAVPEHLTGTWKELVMILFDGTSMKSNICNGYERRPFSVEVVASDWSSTISLMESFTANAEILPVSRISQ